MPARLTRPSVGLMPTMPFDEEGQTIEPSVSVPTARAHRLPLAAAPEPELDPHGLRSSAYGLRHCPPRPLQPLDEWVERKFAHSLRLALPRITAPAARRRAATPESLAAIESGQRERARRGRHPVGGVDVVLHEHGHAV